MKDYTKYFITFLPVHMLENKRGYILKLRVSSCDRKYDEGRNFQGSMGLLITYKA